MADFIANLGSQVCTPGRQVEPGPQRYPLTGIPDLLVTIPVTPADTVNDTAPRPSILQHRSNLLPERIELPGSIRPLSSNLSRFDIDRLRSKRVFDIPSAPSRNALIESCFTFVDYFMPSLEREDFLLAFNGRMESSQLNQGERRMSLLLLYAMMFAGSAVSEKHFDDVSNPN